MLKDGPLASAVLGIPVANGGTETVSPIEWEECECTVVNMKGDVDKCMTECGDAEPKKPTSPFTIVLPCPIPKSNKDETHERSMEQIVGNKNKRVGEVPFSE